MYSTNVRMYSAREYYNKVREKYQEILDNQMRRCMDALQRLLDDDDYKTFTNEYIEVELSERPLPELLLKLSNLGYYNIRYSEENYRFVLRFGVPQLIPFDSVKDDFN